MSSSKKTGIDGEKAAVSFLKSTGYRIISQNFRTKFGEIDIIASKDSCLIFIEVKSRSSRHFGTPSEAVTKKKLDKIIRTSNIFLSQNKISSQDIRYDVVEIFYEMGDMQINHIQNITS